MDDTRECDNLRETAGITGSSFRVKNICPYAAADVAVFCILNILLIVVQSIPFIRSLVVKTMVLLSGTHCIHILHPLPPPSSNW